MDKLFELKYIFFDMGYTLVNEERVWERRCKEQAEKSEARKLGLTSEDIYNEIIRTSLAYQPQYRTVVNKYGFSDVAPYRWELEYLYDDAVKVLEYLSEKYTLGIIANQADGLQARLKALQIEHFFQTVISSWDYKCMKSDKRIFQIALRQAGCKAADAMMIGDRLDNDIYPAKSLGMKTVWIKQGFGGIQKAVNGDYEPDYEINSLSELLNIL